mgnify:CR=1 FL=1
MQALIEQLNPLIEAAALTLAKEDQPEEFYLIHVEDVHHLLVALRKWAEDQVEEP